MRFLIIVLMVLLPAKSFADENNQESAEILWIQESKNIISTKKIMQIIRKNNAEQNKGIYLHLDGPKSEKPVTKRKREIVKKAPHPADTPASLGILGSILGLLLL